MTYLPQLRDQLVAIPPEGRSRRRTVSIGAALSVAGVLLAGGALAAAGVIPTGTPLPAPNASPLPANRGGGAPIASSAHLLALRVADPTGGPPWGVRVFKTTRGTKCVQAGRVVDGKLGALGQDGVSGDDGAFHELPLATMFCSPMDNAGNAFSAVSYPAPAAGVTEPPTCVPTAPHGSKLPPCPDADDRVLEFGLLGPQVESIGYLDRAKALHKQSIDAPEGGYLLVTAEKSARAGFGMGAQPAVGFRIKRIDYRDGTHCGGDVGHDNHPLKCPFGGYAAPQDVPTAAQVRRPVHAHVRRGSLLITFRAPVTIADAGSAYSFFAQLDGGKRCHYGVGGPTDRDYTAGDIVRIAVKTSPGCTHLRGTGTVSYVPSTAKDGLLPTAPGGPGTLLVGSFSLQVP
jgi:hypothetical protein